MIRNFQLKVKLPEGDSRPESRQVEFAAGQILARCNSLLPESGEGIEQKAFTVLEEDRQVVYVIDVEENIRYAVIQLTAPSRVDSTDLLDEVKVACDDSGLIFVEEILKKKTKK